MVLKKLFQVILILSVCSVLNRSVVAAELITPQISVSYAKLSNGTKRIMVSLSARENDKRVSVPDAEIQITNQNGTLSTVLGSVVTNQQGKASLDIDPGTKLARDADGNYTFTAAFGGNKILDKASRSISITDAFLDISFSMKDTVKTITARVFALNNKGETVIVPGLPVEFDVKRLFCLYAIGNEKTDSSGMCSTDFPSSMPGDKNGKVTIVVRIVENETYGTVEESKDLNWGKPLVYEAREIRGLGDTDAPLWMVYTLLILLSAVWLHVVYIIITIIRINAIGKKAIKS